ncbi:MAG: ubiquinone-dependent pyruvate dehydrogenase [Verrucomicrobia bacterium]|nr:ubiquinone-dependent pyruvate dehydrogenase [Verrucomicrobiota bacterium]MBV8482383.1 ubiquinone-dependent pyruvate dehydrogenase [Verrucomicrobiota bacterium]
MTQKTVAEIFIETLIAAGVTRIYGVVGDSLNGILEEVRRSKKIEWIGVRHEETAAFAAGAQAHLTGELAVCAGSCGPGNMHLINGLYDCHRSRVPVLALAAQIPSQEIGSNYFQETHPDQLFRDCSDYCELISQTTQVPRVLEIAIQTALTKKGVAVVAIPGDVALKPAAYRKPSATIKPCHPVVSPSDEEVKSLAALLNDGKAVTILGGAGCAGAHAELMQLAGKLKSPIVSALRGREHIQYDNPYDVGLTGLIGFASGYHAIMAADTLLMLGTDFPYTQFYPEKATVIQVDLRGENLGRRTRLDLGIIGDVKATLRGLLPLVGEKEDDAHLTRFVSHYQDVRKGLDELAVGNPGRKPMHPQYVAKVVDQLAADDAIFSCDVGTPTVWAARYLTMNGMRRLLGSFNHGSMANAMPQAIGAQLTFPGRQVVTFSGDGGLSMMLGDLLSLNQHKLPVKIVVFSNSALAFVELEMLAAGILGGGTELVNPDFVGLARSAGMFAAKVEDPADLKPAVTEAFRHDGPALVEAVVNRSELSMPPTIKVNQAVGFNLWALKAVLNGRGDEVIDLAVSNLVR